TVFVTPLAAILVAAGLQAQTPLPGERQADIAAIPGVVAGDGQRERGWADFLTADGIVGTTDGGVMFAQEQTDTIRKLRPDGSEQVVIANTGGAGSISIDGDGRIYAAERTCTEPFNEDLPGCSELTRISILSPERRVLARSFDDGRPLGRPSDLLADAEGGAYFTAGGAWHVSADGAGTTVVDDDTRSNGIMLSPDGQTLYVPNVTEVLAFDVREDGTTS